MKKVIFDYSLSKELIKTENDGIQISDIDIYELKGIAFGKIYIFFEPQRKYIILETGLLDYLLQLMGVIEEIDSGNFKTFAVSKDWYSNSLDFRYDKQFNTIRIIDVNDEEFDITTNYNRFKKSFFQFYNYMKKELIFSYPELIKNTAYRENFNPNFNELGQKP